MKRKMLRRHRRLVTGLRLQFQAVEATDFSGDVEVEDYSAACGIRVECIVRTLNSALGKIKF